MGSRTAVLTAALLAGLALGSLPIAPAAAQRVPLPVPAPQPKSYGRPTAPGAQQRPPAAVPQQPAEAPSIFPKPPFLFGRSGETTAFDARQRALADRVSAYLSGVRQLTGDFV